MTAPERTTVATAFRAPGAAGWRELMVENAADKDKQAEARKLALERGGGVSFRGADDSVLFFDPTTQREGPPATLVAREPLLQMLENLELTLVWWIGGET